MAEHPIADPGPDSGADDNAGTPDGTGTPRPFRLAFAPGATPGKWARTWEKRLPDVPIDLVPCESAGGTAAVRAREVDAALVRLPVARDGLHAIELYRETTVVVMPKDCTLTLAEDLTPEDLADEVVQHPLDDVLDWSGPPGIPAFERPASTRDALELVAAGVGLTVMPQSLARLHHRKDLVHRPLHGESVAASQVALVFPDGPASALMEEFIGIVRGRTANSSRGLSGQRQKDAADRRAQTRGAEGKRGAHGPRTGAGRGSHGAGGGRSRGRNTGPRRRPRRGRR